ncbi:MAG: ABC transporter ATP-binding protein, partial [Oscillospiraceae bacterium]
SPDVLKGVSLKIPRGTLFAIVGGNGTGKSTTLKTVCGICKPYRGKVLIDGESVGKHKNLFQNCLAMLPQDPQSLFVKKTVQEDLSEMLSGSVAENCRKLKEISEICEISELWNAHPYDLSGGEQQRVALGKVLLCSPRILLLDEPTKGLDNFFKQKLAGVLKRLTAMGTTVILVSHDIEFCAQYADSVSLFFDGNIVTTNTPECFFSQNSFYTTAANRMSRHIFQHAITNREVIALCNANGI